MKKKIAILIPHKGLGDLIFHYSFIKSIHKYHNKSITLFVNKSSKGDLIFKKNKIIKKVVNINLRRPNKFFYLFKIIKVFLKLYKYNFDTLYYTGNNKWHKISFKLLMIFKDFKIYNYKNNEKYIINFLNYFLKKINIKNLTNNNLNIKDNVSVDFIKTLKSYKKPWIFLSIDTSEDQLQIPEKFLIKVINKLDKKYGSIFINTSHKNINKTSFLKNQKIIKTTKFDILEINHIIKRCKQFIGNESGPAILACLYKKKSIIFLNKNIIAESKMMPNIENREYYYIEKIKKDSTNLINSI